MSKRICFISKNRDQYYLPNLSVKDKQENQRITKLSDIPILKSIAHPPVNPTS